MLRCGGQPAATGEPATPATEPTTTTTVPPTTTESKPTVLPTTTAPPTGDWEPFRYVDDWDDSVSFGYHLLSDSEPPIVWIDVACSPEGAALRITDRNKIVT